MRLIDADLPMRSFQVDMCGGFACHECPLLNDDGECGFEVFISDTPTVDAVPIVRCKDCKHYKEFRTKRNKQIMRLCCRMGKNDMEYSVKPDDFCSYGERKDVIQK